MAPLGEAPALGGRLGEQAWGRGPVGHRVGGTVCICFGGGGHMSPLRGQVSSGSKSYCSTSLQSPLLAAFLKALFYQRHGLA